MGGFSEAGWAKPLQSCQTITLSGHILYLARATSPTHNLRNVQALSTEGYKSKSQLLPESFLWTRWEIEKLSGARGCMFLGLVY